MFEEEIEAFKRKRVSSTEKEYPQIGSKIPAVENKSGEKTDEPKLAKPEQNVNVLKFKNQQNWGFCWDRRWGPGVSPGGRPGSQAHPGTGPPHPLGTTQTVTAPDPTNFSFKSRIETKVRRPLHFVK